MEDFDIFDEIFMPDENEVTKLLCRELGIDNNSFSEDLALSVGEPIRVTKRVRLNFERELNYKLVTLGKKKACVMVAESIRKELNGKEVIYICCERYSREIFKRTLTIFMDLYYIVLKNDSSNCEENAMVVAVAA